MKAGVRRILATFVMTNVVLGVGVAAAQSPPNDVELYKQVDFVNEASLIVYVTVSCMGTTPTGSVTVTVVQAHPPATTGTGVGDASSVICDGTKRKYAVDVFGGPFQLGSAAASAILLNPALSDTDARSVRITRP